MQKMMTYSEANSVLESSLSPTNRCLSKAVAIANDANPDLLANFENNRLVSASLIEKTTHWLDEHIVEHYFVDENGNKIGDGKSLSITLPQHGEVLVVRTKALLDGQPFPDDVKGGHTAGGDDTPDPEGGYSDWVHNDGVISTYPYHIHARFDVHGNELPTCDQYTWERDDYGLIDPTSYFGSVFNQIKDKNGISTYVLICPLDYSRANMPGGTPFHIRMNDWYATANKLNTIDVVNLWNINLSVDRAHRSYDINRGIIDFERAEIGQESTETYLTGFGDGPNDYEIVYVGYYIYLQTLNESTDGKISDVIKSENGTSFKIVRTGDSLYDGLYRRKTINLYKIYKKSDPSVCVYFVVSFDPIPQ